MSRAPCPGCRDELGDPLGDLHATAPGERKPCAEPGCEEGWIELEACQACGEEVRNLYELDGAWLCADCHDERTDAQPVIVRPVETIDLADFAARVCGMKP